MKTGKAADRRGRIIGYDSCDGWTTYSRARHTKNVWYEVLNADGNAFYGDGTTAGSYSLDRAVEKLADVIATDGQGDTNSAFIRGYKEEDDPTIDVWIEQTA